MMIAKNSVRLLVVLLLFSCAGNAQEDAEESSSVNSETYKVTEMKYGPRPAAEDLSLYVERLIGKRLALVANHTSRVGQRHLVDALLDLGIEVSHVYAPEHGFRGDQDAGAIIKDEIDASTGLRLYSLHGKHKKPTPASLDGIDIVVFDIQDVGVRFYTYISTLHYVMEACAENDIPLVVLDRPNPNLAYMPDGPVLNSKFSSFVGMHEVPILYGLTIGEYARMINGERWLNDGIQVDLTVIPCSYYSRTSSYELPIAPSPNLPNKKSIYLYPSLCFFEGTIVSIGRGTDYPFQVVGHPDFKLGSYSFIPESNTGSKYPKLEGETCFGVSISKERAEDIHETAKLDLGLLIHFYQELDKGDDFFREDGFFDMLAGTDELRKQIQSGVSEGEIRATWNEGLREYREMYMKYWIYE